MDKKFILHVYNLASRFNFWLYASLHYYSLFVVPHLSVKIKWVAPAFFKMHVFNGLNHKFAN